jgi:predicted nucleic acid-binding protein
VIIDSSAWIDFFRDRDTPAAAALTRALEDETVPLMTTDIIRLEILAGATGESVTRQMNRALAACEDIHQLARADVDDAVSLYDKCRRRGETLRSPIDCLIAAIAIRAEVPVLHSDADFEVIARHSRLRTVTA